MSSQDGAVTSPTDSVTLIVTTSPTPSAPSTDLIVSILESFRLHCPVLLSCRVIVVFDTYDRIGDRMRLKRGQITAEGAKAVELYKINVKELILERWCPKATCSSSALVQTQGLAEFGSPKLVENHIALSILQTDNKQVTFVEPAKRLGFGLAVRSALRLTETPYVWIQQHDWPLVRDIPLYSIIAVMQASDTDTTAPVKYVCLPAVRMLYYAVSPHVLQFPSLRAFTQKLKRNFFPATQQPDSDGDGVPLTPLFFWHDKPHIASTAHYLARVFPSRLALIRGDFIEDKVGQRARAQMKDGNWVKWASWLYYPGDGKEICLRHRHGRMWQGVEGELQFKAQFSEMKNKQSSSPAPESSSISYGPLQEEAEAEAKAEA